LVNCIKCEQKYLSKINSLKKVIRDSSFEIKAFQNSNYELYIKVDTFETEKKEVQLKCEGFQKLIYFRKGEKFGQIGS